MIINSNNDLFLIKKTLIEKGIFVVDKPLNWTSQDVVSFLKHFLNVKKIGHGGTLDPLASGLLIIAVNENTKKLNDFLNSIKTYKTTILLNQSTETGDLEGKILNTSNYVPKIIEIKKAILFFTTNFYWQKPHKFSAVKIAGKKLYEYSRKNQKVNIAPKLVELKECNLINYNYPELELELTVSKGFYVRTFAEDLGEYLKTCGCLKNLKRIEAHNFSLNDETLDILQLKDAIKKFKINI